MEKLLKLWDETDELISLAPRVLAAIAAAGLIIAAACIDRLWTL
jgi:preprotein translocase subunit Sec61beta